MSCGTLTDPNRGFGDKAWHWAGIPAEERFWACIEFEQNSGCWLWTASLRKGGYGQFWVDGRATLAHRFSWELHNGAIPEGKIVRHKCDTPACSNPHHLCLGLYQDNSNDMVVRGRSLHLPGELGHNAKLSKDDVTEIRRLLSVRVPQKQIADKFGVSQPTICLINRKKTWSE